MGRSSPHTPDFSFQDVRLRSLRPPPKFRPENRPDTDGIFSPPLQLLDSITGSVFLFSHGTFSCPANLLPWRSGGGSGGGGSSGVYKKSHRRVASSENVPGLERLLKAWNLTESPQGLGQQGRPDPREPLIPLLLGPCMGLWRECYLRGALHAQVCHQ